MKPNGIPSLDLGRQMTASAGGELDEMALDELERARSLSWRELSGIVPWGDVYEGFAPAGRPVQVERNYLWADKPGGDILCEVNVYANLVLYDDGARRSCVIVRG